MRRRTRFRHSEPVTAERPKCPVVGLPPLQSLVRAASARGAMRAAVAIAHKILVSIWHMLSNGTFHQDPGPGFLDKMDRERTSKPLVRRLVNKGFEVQLREKAA